MKRARDETYETEDSSSGKRSEVSGDRAPHEHSTGHDFRNIHIRHSVVHLGDRHLHTESTENVRSRQGEEAEEEELKFKLLKKSLEFDSINTRLNVIGKALAHTCDWLLLHDDYRRWRESTSSAEHNGFFWIRGKPGCGKSTLMKVALQHVEKDIASASFGNRSVTLQYFFNARSNKKLDKSVIGLYRSLTYQILEVCAKLQCTDLRSLFLSKFGAKADDDEWTSEELQDFLNDAMATETHIDWFIFIDALDEGDIERDIRGLIGFLVDVAERVQVARLSSHLRICLSSRHYPHISVSKGLFLTVEEQVGHAKDIDKYIAKKLYGGDTRDKAELRSHIRHKSAHVFLWVVLVVEILNSIYDHGGSMEDMKTRIASTPADLDKLFREILFKVPALDEQSLLLFQWMLYGARGFSPAELYLAIQCSCSNLSSCDTPYNSIAPPEVKRLQLYLLGKSRGLIEITIGSSPTVQFIHETVRAYLKNALVTQELFPSQPRNLYGSSHDILRQGCQKYIASSQMPHTFGRFVSQGIVPPRLDDKFPFMQYAVEYMFAHSNKAAQAGVPQEEFVKQQAGPDGLWIESSKNWYNACHPSPGMRYDTRTPLVFVLTERRCPLLIPAIPNVASTINMVCGESRSTLLHSACKSNDLQMVQALLDAGAIADIPCRRGETPLHIAAETGSVAIVKALIDAGANVNAFGDSYSFALRAASAKNHVRIVGMLLEAGADVDAQHGSEGNALYMAAKNGHARVIGMLLQAGAQVDAPGGRHGTAVNVAVKGGFTDIVRLLKERGAQV